jgi:hypothetical protein
MGSNSRVNCAVRNARFFTDISLVSVVFKEEIVPMKIYRVRDLRFAQVVLI